MDLKCIGQPCHGMTKLQRNRKDSLCFKTLESNWRTNDNVYMQNIREWVIKGYFIMCIVLEMDRLSLTILRKSCKIFTVKFYMIQIIQNSHLRPLCLFFGSPKTCVCLPSDQKYDLMNLNI